MQEERLNADSSVTRKQCGQIDHIVFPYGVQKGWERVTSPETGAENFSEITDAEAKQLGFPF